MKKQIIRNADDDTFGKKKMSRLRAFYNGSDTFFAYDAADGLRVLEEFYGEGYLTDTEETETCMIEILDMNQPYNLEVEDAVVNMKLPKKYTVIEPNVFRATIGDWMKAIGRGFLGSENF